MLIKMKSLTRDREVKKKLHKINFGKLSVSSLSLSPKTISGKDKQNPNKNHKIHCCLHIVNTVGDSIDGPREEKAMPPASKQTI
jgi:hypothetical protein